MVINRQDTNGVKPLLGVGELGYDNYPTGGDAGRVYVGTGSVNIPQAKKAEVVAVDGKVDTHVARVDNPHTVTKTQVGLGSVDNTSDINKPISTATQTALDTKQAVLVSGTNIKTIEGQSIVGSGNIDLSKGDVGLSNVDNTADSAKVVASAGKWTTSRDITIGNAVKAVNGAGDVTWTLNEIGAIPRVTSTDNAVVRFDGATGQVQNSGVIIDDSGNLTINSGALRGSYGGGNIATNFAAGDLALVSNTTGYRNTANGEYALYSNTTGSSNTANGRGALLSNTTGDYNTANGVGALYSNTTGYRNTASGLNALLNNTTGYQNTANGVNALLNNTTFANVSGFGNNSQATGSNQVQLGDANTTTYVYGTVQNRSDIRDKADVRDTILGLDFIKSLRPVDYKWDMREDYKPERPNINMPETSDENYEELKAEYDRIIAEWLEACKPENIVRDGSKKRSRYHQGFIAQEVQALDIDFGGLQDHSIKGGHDVLSIGYDEIIAPLVKAVQEQQVMIDLLKAKIDILEGGN